MQKISENLLWGMAIKAAQKDPTILKQTQVESTTDNVPPVTETSTDAPAEQPKHELTITELMASIEGEEKGIREKIKTYGEQYRQDEISRRLKNIEMFEKIYNYADNKVRDGVDVKNQLDVMETNLRGLAIDYMYAKDMDAKPNSESMDETRLARKIDGIEGRLKDMNDDIDFLRREHLAEEIKKSL